MANVSLRELLAAPTVTGRVRTTATPDQYFTNFFNLGPNSAQVEDVSGHDFSYDVFNPTKEPADLRAPGTGPATVDPIPTGFVRGTLPRAHIKIPLLDEQVFRLRRIGQGYDTVDKSGQQYVAMQTEELGRRFNNFREYIISAMLKGKMGVLASGLNWIPVAAGAGTFDIDFQVPAGNKDQLNMTGGGDILGVSWDNAAAPIPTDCQQINRAFKQLHGRPLRHAFIASSTFQLYVMTNTDVKAQAGTANKVWRSWNLSRYVNADGQRDTGFEVVLEAIPWLTWHLYDGQLTINGTAADLMPEGFVNFLPDPDSSWITGIQGSEMIRENKLSAPEERYGMQAWTEGTTQPAGFELIGVDQFIPKLKVPSCVAYGDVLF